MTFEETMKTLESRGTAQARKTYTRHGAKPPMFGVSYADFGKLIKQIKRDHDLATKLWATGNYDARIFATMIADPQKLDEKLLARWAKDIDSYPIADAFSRMAAQSPVNAKMAEQLAGSDEEFVSATGWNMLAYAARMGAMTDAQCEKRLKQIEKNIHGAQNRVKHAMNQVLICIGSRGGDMTEKAIAAAKRIGKVEVDHGDTDCKSPDAIQYIQKMLARKKK